MILVKGYAAQSPKSPLTPFQFNRRDPGSDDILIDINYCGICHSDLHQVRNEWGGSLFPMVPGHEIVGKVEKVGVNVKKLKPGDLAGVGCMVDSCGECQSCKEGVEQFCQRHLVMTYNSLEKDGSTPTYGGYSTKIVVDQRFVFSIPPQIPLAQAAPLLCAGITTYSPLRRWDIGPDSKIAVMGLGGLGHMAVKIGSALGAEVTVFSSSEKKREDARRLGVTHFATGSDDQAFKRFAKYFNLIINTISAPLDLSPYLMLLKREGTMVLVGAPEHALSLHPLRLISAGRKLAGSLIGGVRETQEMLNFCGERKIACDVEVIQMDYVNEAYERMVKGDVRYRFVIDLKSLR